MAVGCSTTENANDNANQAPRPEPVYRTGSNIPIRDARPLTKEEKERQTEESQRALESMRQTGAGNPNIK